MYKRCPVCRTTWRSASSFVDDGELLLIGVQGALSPDRLHAVFVHSCGTTLTASILELASRGLLADDAPRAPAWRVASTLRKPAGRALSEALFMAVADPSPPGAHDSVSVFH